MTKHFCDTCGKEMESNGIKSLPIIRFDIGTIANPKPCATGKLSDCTGLIGNYREWTEAPPGFICQFNTSFVSVCSACVLQAFKEAVAAL